MKKMKKKLIGLFILVILVLVVYALFKPTQTQILMETIQGPPLPPPIDPTCEIEWEIKDKYCSGDILMYKQCVYVSLEDLEWQIRSDNCNQLGEGFTCLIDKCVYVGILKLIIPYWWLIVIFIVIGIIAYKKKWFK